MAEKKTAEQVRDEYVQVFGPTLGPLFYALSSEVTWLHAIWGQYRILFAESGERVQMLNDVAGSFFYVIQKVLWEDVVLHIARLVDRSQSGEGKDNLTLSQLATALEAEDSALSIEIANLVEKARDEAKFATDWRNRHIAHRDLNLALGRKSKPLPEISRKKIECALAAMRVILSRIGNHFRQGETLFTEIIARGGADDLAFYLKVAIDSQSREREHMLQSLKRPK